MAPTDIAVISSIIVVCLASAVDLTFSAELKGNRNYDEPEEIYNYVAIDHFNKKMQAIGHHAALKGILLLFKIIPFLWWTLGNRMRPDANATKRQNYPSLSVEAVPIQNRGDLDEFGLACQIPDPIWRHNENDETGVTLEYFWLNDHTIQLSHKKHIHPHDESRISNPDKTEKEIDPSRCAFCNCRGHTVANCHQRKVSKL